MEISVESFLEYAVMAGATDLILAEGLVPAVRIASNTYAIPDAPAIPLGTLEKFTGPLPDESGAFCGGPWCNYHWRVRYSREAFGKMACFRLLTAECPDLASLGVPGSVQNLLHLGSGLVIFAGPVASGKTKTASSFVSAYSQVRVCRAAFLEPLQEYNLAFGESLVQMRRPKTEMTGEIRQGLLNGTDLFWLGNLSSEFFISALKAAEAGSLVVGTANGGSIAGVFDSIVAAEPAENQSLLRSLLACNLKAVVFQRTVPMASGEGSVCLWEVLYNNPTVSSLIRSGEHYKFSQVIAAGAAEGMHSMDLSLAAAVKSGQISREEAMRFAFDESQLR